MTTETETTPTPPTLQRIEIDVGSMDVAAATAEERRAELAESLAGVEAITTEEERAVISAVRTQAKLYRAELRQDFEPTAKALRAEAARISKRWKDRDAPLEAVQSQVDRLLSSYDLELARQQREEDRKRQEAAKAEAEDELLERAAALEDAGHEDAAVELLEGPAPVPVLPRASNLAPAAPPREETTAKVWTYEFDDPTGFAGVKEAYLAPRQPARALIRAKVNQLHEAAAEEVGGIKVFQKGQVRDK